MADKNVLVDILIFHCKSSVIVCMDETFVLLAGDLQKCSVLCTSLLAIFIQINIICTISANSAVK